ncbi:helix-turn-helix domain-containing protein [Flavobacterium salilacus subsp. salilacus]|uniref:helix-turn-helix domain-containing protein n=1 Tax=Flavobacterium TaxID=237 RepID=UPI001075765A|nr:MULTISPECIES: helix-turn-helix domain-containing protein [Flavobacterium]KAF2520132.1 helix-turn-helix domain-containing protein [Flavobacterium salilacus subsp. salilacus]MBE1613952.1 helix-turn-helix domain-containing protein [Flavobacterium sp. SaA2.13]
MKILIAQFIFLLIAVSAYSQAVPQRKIDSLEQVLVRMNRNDTDEIVKLGEYLIAHTDSDEKKYYFLGIIISSYATKGDKEKSIKYLFRAKKIAKDIGDAELITKVYVTIASLYTSLNLNEKAMMYLQDAWKETEKLPIGEKRSSITAFLYNEQGNFYFNNKEYKQANDNYKLSIEEFRKTLKSQAANTPFYYKSLLHNYGKSFLHFNEPDSAEIYLNKALIVNDTLYPNLKYLIYNDLSEAYTAKGSYRRAIDTLQVMLKDKNFNIPELQSSVYLKLSSNYKAIGDMSNYALYNEKYLTLTPLVKSEDLNAINTVFNAEQYEIISESRKESYLFIGGALLAIVASGIYIFILYRKKKKEQSIYKSIIDNLESRLIIPLTNVVEPETVPESHLSIMPSVEQDILNKLKQFENSTRFTNAKLTIATLAVQFKTNTSYLSEIINREKGKNFNAYINGLRINYICSLIHSNPEYLNYKISYLAETCGFSSHSAFATVFKSITGISPSAFLKQAAITRGKKL